MRQRTGYRSPNQRPLAAGPRATHTPGGGEVRKVEVQHAGPAPRGEDRPRRRDLAAVAVVEGRGRSGRGGSVARPCQASSTRPRVTASYPAAASIGACAASSLRGTYRSGRAPTGAGRRSRGTSGSEPAVCRRLVEALRHVERTARLRRASRRSRRAPRADGRSSPQVARRAAPRSSAACRADGEGREAARQPPAPLSPRGDENCTER